MTRSPAGLTFLAVFILLMLGGMALGLVWIPWQQTVVAPGALIVLDPDDRPQEVHAPIQGRLERWLVQEGEGVSRGQRILELAEIDVKFLGEGQLSRLVEQIRASENQAKAMEDHVKALEEQILAMEKAREAVMAAARAKVTQSLQKIEQERQSMRASGQSLEASAINIDRIESLEKQGLRSRRDRELASVSLVKDQAELQKSEAAVVVAQQGAEVARMELAEKESDLYAKIFKERASLASAREKLASIRKEILKLEIEKENLDHRIAQRVVKSPCNGRMVRLLKRGEGETVKPGDVLAIIVPDTRDLAVELFVRDHDAPLLMVGSPVRLQFAGFPALQFTGWPQLSVGTFAGVIHVIDAVSDGEGQYRVLVTPDAESIAAGREPAWPGLDRLRPGAGVTGWVMLSTVSLGFELWRQFNAFPPIPVMSGKDEKSSSATGVEGMIRKKIQK